MHGESIKTWLTDGKGSSVRCLPVQPMRKAVGLAACPIEGSIVGIRAEEHGVAIPQRLLHKNHLLDVGTKNARGDT